MEVALIVQRPMEREVRDILGVHALNGADLNADVGALVRERGLTVPQPNRAPGD
jgi:hypothetical protein